MTEGEKLLVQRSDEDHGETLSLSLSLPDLDLKNSTSMEGAVNGRDIVGDGVTVLWISAARVMAGKDSLWQVIVDEEVTDCF